MERVKGSKRVKTKRPKDQKGKKGACTANMSGLYSVELHGDRKTQPGLWAEEVRLEGWVC